MENTYVAACPSCIVAVRDDIVWSVGGGGGGDGDDGSVRGRDGCVGEVAVLGRCSGGINPGAGRGFWDCGDRIEGWW